MKISFEWLKDYVQIDEPAGVIAGKMTMAGLEVVRMTEADGDTVMDVEVTTNRPDCLSVIGIAREISAITGKKLKIPASLAPHHTLALLRKPALYQTKSRPGVKLEIKDPEGCRRYAGWLIGGVKVGPSPEWLARRLELCGIRPINNVVDVTNYCLLELGQPFHAFDYEKLEGRTIIVRRAEKNEKIMTIDGEERKLDEETLVIADAKRPVAVAGVMGGLKTEISASTKFVFIEAAHFNPAMVRRTSQRFGLSSESSYRFERNVNLEDIFVCSCRVLDLMNKFTGSRQIGKVIDVGQKRLPPRIIRLRVDRLNQVLGMLISPAQVKKILLSLQFHVRPYGEDRFQVNVPCFRQDISREIDLIEEVARLYGYDRIPVALSTGPFFLSRRLNEREVTGRKKSISSRERKKVTGKDEVGIKELICERLSAQGMDEVITYSLISRDSIEKVNSDAENAIPVENPLSSEQAFLRPTQIPGMLKVVAGNLNQKISDQGIFELGRVFSKGKGREILEKTCLSMCLRGTRISNWRMNPGNCSPGILMVDFFDMKGVIDNLLAELGIEKCSYRPSSHPLFKPGRSASLMIGEKQAGNFGELKSEILERFDVISGIYAGEFYLDDIFSRVKLKRRFRHLIRYPSVVRDLAVVVDENIPSGDILSLIDRTGDKLVRNVTLFDEYVGKQIPRGKKSLAYSIEYQAHGRTLTEEEVEKLHQQIRQKLTEEFAASFR